MSEITLPQILQAREARALRQTALLSQYGVPLICFTMNIPGPVKCSPLILRAFREGLALLEARLSEKTVLFREHTESTTGCEAFYVVNMPAQEIKKICTAIEDATPMGRLFDMDVLDSSGSKLERKNLRGCMVCGAPGRGCAARRSHSVEALQEQTDLRITEYFAKKDRDAISALAADSLMKEVRITPKPGLVDCRNTGSHRDMDLVMFLTSAHALTGYFADCIAIGQEDNGDIFPALRRAGLEAEKTMYRATGGVNTHKGAIFTLGILCGALGQLWTPEAPVPALDALLQQCSLIAKAGAEADLASADDSTAGLRLYRKTGLPGIRGEVASGLPSVAKIGLPAYQKALQEGLNENDAGARALLSLIARVEDTNLYHRGGAEGAAFAKAAAQAVLETGATKEALELLDDAFIARNLSPGGCADLLAATLFLHSLNNTDIKRSAIP